jgi:clorobiocin biosynthesis protein Clo-hal
LKSVDVAVVGAGPAGATTACLVRRYAPGARVVVLDRAHHPRHHVGESLVVDVNRILWEMGAYDAVESRGFLPKAGGTFVWGLDRDPWSILFTELADIVTLRRPGNLQLDYTWHVERHAYDALLTDVARDLGAEVRTGVDVRGPVVQGGRVVGVVARSESGAEEEIPARFVIDASGQRALLGGPLGKRTVDPFLQNIAVYAYLSGARLDPRLCGSWDLARIFVVTIPIGWIWYIPLRRDLVSVGVVTSKRTFQARSGDLERFFREHLATAPELAPLVAGATVVRHPNAAREFLVERDFCWTTERVAGPGWALVGDAAGFVDPIFSIGVFLAQSSAYWLGYALATILRGDAIEEDIVWRAYDDYVRTTISAFRTMTYFWYGFNGSKESFWWEARRALRSSALPPEITDRQAFLALATGYGVNRSLFNEATTVYGERLFSDMHRELVDGSDALPELRRLEGVSDDAVLRLAAPVDVVPFAMPLEGTGRLVPVDKVRFGPEDDLPRRLYVPPGVGRVFERLREPTTVSALAADARSRGLPARTLGTMLAHLRRGGFVTSA